MWDVFYSNHRTTKKIFLYRTNKWPCKVPLTTIATRFQEDSSEFKHNPTLIASVSVLCVSQQTLKDTLKYLT